MEKGSNEKFCAHCGELIDINAEICPKCGVRVMAPKYEKSRFNNRWLASLLLAIFGGGIGLHRFYNGRVISGILMILTLGGLGIWTFIDIILISCGSFKDCQGNEIGFFK